MVMMEMPFLPAMPVDVYKRQDVAEHDAADEVRHEEHRAVQVAALDALRERIGHGEGQHVDEHERYDGKQRREPERMHKARILERAAVVFKADKMRVARDLEFAEGEIEDVYKRQGLSNTYIFWRIRMPYCRQGVLAGTVLAFARALGEYGATSMIAGYTPGKTATISTTVYQLWQTNNDVLATKWVLVNIAISAVVLLAVNMLERRDFLTDASKARRARR